MFYRNLWKDHANGLIISRGVMCFLKSEGNKGLCWFSSYCTLLCVMDFYSQSSPFGITYKDLKSINLIVMGSLHAAKKMQMWLNLLQRPRKSHFVCLGMKKHFLKTLFLIHTLLNINVLYWNRWMMIVEKVCQIIFNPLKVLKLLFFMAKPVKTSLWGLALLLRVQVVC